jgi:hypothetical protein
MHSSSDDDDANCGLAMSEGGVARAGEEGDDDTDDEVTFFETNTDSVDRTGSGDGVNIDDVGRDSGSDVSTEGEASEDEKCEGDSGEGGIAIGLALGMAIGLAHPKPAVDMMDPFAALQASAGQESDSDSTSHSISDSPPAAAAPSPPHARSTESKRASPSTATNSTATPAFANLMLRTGVAGSRSNARATQKAMISGMRNMEVSGASDHLDTNREARTADISAAERGWGAKKGWAAVRQEFVAPVTVEISEHAVAQAALYIEDGLEDRDIGTTPDRACWYHMYHSSLWIKIYCIACAIHLGLAAFEHPSILRRTTGVPTTGVPTPNPVLHPAGFAGVGGNVPHTGTGTGLTASSNTTTTTTTSGTATAAASAAADAAATSSRGSSNHFLHRGPLLASEYTALAVEGGCILIYLVDLFLRYKVLK